jgi:hypothetical protein
MDTEVNNMKLEHSKEWWMKMAEREGDHAIGAGYDRTMMYCRSRLWWRVQSWIEWHLYRKWK